MLKLEPQFRFVCSPMGSLCHTPGVVCHMSSVATITARNNMLSNPYLVQIFTMCPGFCLLDIGVPVTLALKLCLKN